MRGDLGLENDVEAESFKPTDELFPGALGASLVEVCSTELRVGLALEEHVVDSDQDLHDPSLPSDACDGAFDDCPTGDLRTATTIATGD